MASKLDLKRAISESDSDLEPDNLYFSGLQYLESSSGLRIDSVVQKNGNANNRFSTTPIVGSDFLYFLDLFSEPSDWKFQLFAVFGNGSSSNWISFLLK